MSPANTGTPEGSQSHQSDHSIPRMGDTGFAQDAFVVIVLSLVATYVGGRFDLFESWYTFVILHEGWELDELTIGIFAFAFLSVWFSWRRLRQANILARMAKKHEQEAFLSSKAKSEFLACMSHELRTPLNAINGYSEAMAAGIFGEMNNAKQLECLGDIQNSGQHLLKLINDILDLSKIEAGKEVLFEREIEIRSAMDSSLRPIKIMAEKKRIALSIDVIENPPGLLGDERRIVQVFINLLSNAVKFTPEGGSVSFVAELDERDGYVVSVSDTGIGIPKQDLTKVMMPFEQSLDIKTGTREGTGLGLALSHSLMKLHSGMIEIASDLGMGTTVKLHFPPERTIRHG